jgi:hypothetical protein
VLHYEPQGSALDQIPTPRYDVSEVLAEYEVAGSHEDDFLSIVLDRLEAHYGLHGFAGDFTIDFESFLQSVDSDPKTPGAQPYLDPSGSPILSLADTQWFGPRVTWPSELSNHPYIHFWHRLDRALLAADVPGMGPEVLGDDEWRALFTSGPLPGNPYLTIFMKENAVPGFAALEVDQLGNARPEDELCDIGAIEKR